MLLKGLTQTTYETNYIIYSYHTGLYKHDLILKTVIEINVTASNVIDVKRDFIMSAVLMNKIITCSLIYIGVFIVDN